MSEATTETAAISDLSSASRFQSKLSKRYFLVVADLPSNLGRFRLSLGRRAQNPNQSNLYIRRRSKLADYAADLGIRAFNMRGPNGPERITGSEVSANFLRVLGIAPLSGRSFADNAGPPGATRTAILSNAFWTQRFGATRDVLGRQLVLDEVRTKSLA